MTPGLQDRINQFRQIAQDDPENDLAHFRLGQFLMEDGQHAEAISALRKTLMISPNFSKVFVLLAKCELALDKKSDAIRTLTEGFRVADSRGDRVPRDEMAQMLRDLGETPPEAPKKEKTGTGGGFQCHRPGCYFGDDATKLTSPPLPDEIGQRIMDEVCVDCWNEWLKNQSIKVINELRLDLSLEPAQAEYDKYMRAFFGFDEPKAEPAE